VLYHSSVMESWPHQYVNHIDIMFFFQAIHLLDKLHY